MTLHKTNTIPDLLRTFEKNTNKYKLTHSLFITDVDFSITESEFEDSSFWYDHLGIDIFPLHNITQFAPEDEKNVLIQSKQDFTYKARNGKYKHRVSYDVGLDYHQLLNSIDNNELRVIYVSNNVIRGTKVGTDDIRGFKLSSFSVEKLEFAINSTVGTTQIFLELFDSDELNVNGYEVEVDWSPRLIDRLVMKINLTFYESYIIANLTYQGEAITNVSSNDVTITDINNGNITFSLSNIGSGLYKLSNFSNTMTESCIYVKSTLYIGTKRFNYTFVVAVTTNALFQDGDNILFQDGNNKLFQ